MKIRKNVCFALALVMLLSCFAGLSLNSANAEELSVTLNSTQPSTEIAKADYFNIMFNSLIIPTGRKAIYVDERYEITSVVLREGGTAYKGALNADNVSCDKGTMTFSGTSATITGVNSSRVTLSINDDNLSIGSILINYKEAEGGRAHAFVTAWTTNETAHWHKCEGYGCDITDYATCGLDGAAYGAHVDDDKNGICDVCARTGIPIPPPLSASRATTTIRPPSIPAKP